MYNFPDSQVFAEEVEPTGAVAMEIVLERYRRAALRAASGGGNAVGNSTNARARNHHPDFDKRLQPR